LITILLADDHALFRDGMRELLNNLWPKLTLLETATYGQTLDMLQSHRDIDLILLDLSMPGSDYIHGVQSILVCAAKTPLIVISARQSQEVIHSVLALGAKGYIPKSSDSKVMAHAIGLVLEGGRYIPPESLGESAEATCSTMLTDRQRQVLSLLAEGLCNKDICHYLGICDRTVKMHVSALMAKLGVENRTQLALMAVSGRV